MPRGSKLTLDLLQTFVTLLDNEGNAAAAGRALGVNQPSMSKRLQRLQHAGPLLARAWLTRQGKGWKPTAEGRRVLPVVGDIIDRYENLQRFVSDNEADVRRIHFGCGQQAVRTFVRRALCVFRARHPGVRLRISTLRGRARIERVANGSLDLASVTHEESAIQAIARRSLHVQPIRTDRLALVCARNVAWSEAMQELPEANVPLAAMARFPLILPAPEAAVRRMLDRALRERALLRNLDVVLETGGWQTILDCVSDGLGVGVVSEAALCRPSAYVVRYVDPAAWPPAVTKLICRRGPNGKDGSDLSDDARAWRDILLQAARERPREGTDDPASDPL